MIVDCISDLHGEYPKLEGGDLLIIAGDITSNDSFKAWDIFFKWLNAQDYKKKIYIGGNHDKFLTCCLASSNPLVRLFCENEKIEYLCDSNTEFEGLKIWGSPWTSIFKEVNPLCKSFMIDKNKLKEKWKCIPDDIDILITHSPPFGMMDKDKKGKHLGSISLADRVLQLKNLKLHVFGHIHYGYGQCHRAYEMKGLITQIDMRDDNNFKPIGHLSVNASHMNEDYEPINKPIRVIL